MEGRTWIHAFTDGRTSHRMRPSPTSPSCRRSESRRVVGRYFAMDRDQRWERTQKGLDAITLGTGA